MTLFDYVSSGDCGIEEANPLNTSFIEANPAPSRSKETDEAHEGHPHNSRSADVSIASGQKAKARDILAAISVVKNIEHGGHDATGDERRALMRFCGFGSIALNIFPDPVTGQYKDGWQSHGDDLKALLTPAEYDSAKRSTFNAFYTSSAVIRAMFQALSRLGIPDNALVLEPGCGPGRFPLLAPESMRFIGIELDGLSARIAKALHPGHDIRHENFRDSKLPAIDAVIGNVPFADLKLDYDGQRLSLHDFFFAKSVDALKPGGVLALVTSHFTLDKQNAAIREALAGKADFVGAVRLPSDAFKREGTAVVTDIIFMRKRSLDEPASHADPEWLATSPLCIDGRDVAINRYFLNHPEMVLGTWSSKDTLYGNEGYSLLSNGELAQQLHEAIACLPQFAPLQITSTPDDFPHRSETKAAFTPPPLERHINEGSFFLKEDRTICQLVDGLAVPVIYGGTKLSAGGTMTGKRFAALIGLRDKARRVLQSQNEGWPEEHRVDARRELNWAYDRFISCYGPVNKTTFSETKDRQVIRRMPNLVKFREDPDAMLVMSLENYLEETGRASKAPILERDVVGKLSPITHVNTAEEGLLVSLNQRGVVDLAFIAELYGKSMPEIFEELGDLVFSDAETGEIVTADEYLSGNVRAKLIEAQHGGEPRNVLALKSVQPEDVLPGDIDANLGAPWIPETDIQGYAAELFKVEPSAIQVAHLAKDAAWSIDADYTAQKSVGATSEFGTSRINGVSLLEQALNMKTPTIYDTVHHGDREEKVVNQEETLSAREKQKQIKERFKAWVFADSDRTERLVRLYNDNFNNIRLRQFDGSHLTFPGMNEAFTLRKHQKDAVWRGMSSGNTLLAHVVGAGKTAVMVATGMKMRQAGLIKKPLYVVPNHLLEQFAREFQQIYPNAKLLVAAKEDFTRDRRKLLTAKVATGDWDGVVVTHSSFERIGMSSDYQERFLTEQIQEYQELLCDAAMSKAAKAQRNLIKTIEKQKAAREQKLKDLLAEDKKDDGLVFDELGIDHIFIDESQYFKNLETPTKMERVAGIQTGGSERAFDLYMKTRYLHQQNPKHGVTFATGTPISNSLCEMYTLQRFLDPDGLKCRAIEHFDAWAATFGEVVEAMEIAPDGASLRPRSRFAKFVNLPELQQMFRSFADVQTADMLDLPRPRLQGDKPQTISRPMSAEQQELQQGLVRRYERIRSEKVDPREDNALKITTEGRKLALDARLLSGDASGSPDSKLEALLEQVADIWRGTAASRATQMIFCDMGVHTTPWAFSAYEEVQRGLVALGIPKEQIAAIGDAESDAKKQALFEKVRQGHIRVLIGSTQKMGTGTNVQKRLIALHHLDAPWKPAEVEQRDGRILRQGNDNEEVAIYRYVTEGSFDAYMWQTLETKARFISQIMTGENGLRKAEDIGSQELSYAEVKAIASGNPAVLTLAEADAELQRLAMLRKCHMDEQFLARRSVRDLPATIERLSIRLTNLIGDEATAKSHAGDHIIIGDSKCLHDDAPAVLGARLNGVPENSREIRNIRLGIYRGLRFGLVLHPFSAPDVFLEGASFRQTGFLSDSRGPRAVLNALERVAGSYAGAIADTQQDLSIAQGQLREYQARLGKPFKHGKHLEELATLRDQLRAGLSAQPGAPEAEASQQAISELAEQIKTLMIGDARHH